MSHIECVSGNITVVQRVTPALRVAMPLLFLSWGDQNRQSDCGAGFCHCSAAPSLTVAKRLK
jgi:hypothetical protein